MLPRITARGAKRPRPSTHVQLHTSRRSRDQILGIILGSKQRLIVLTLCVALVVFWSVWQVPATLTVIDNGLSFNDKHEKNDDMKYILYYTPFWNHKDYKFGFGHEPFQTMCRSSRNNKCYATDNRQYLKSMGEFDAVIFHSIDFDFQRQAPSIQQWRKQHQCFVYFNAESPHTYASTPNAFQFYNWTMTYRQDSDVVRSYGWFERHGHPQMYSPPLQTSEWPIVYDKHSFLKQEDLIASLAPLARRPNKVAWIVSNCKTASKRHDYVDEMSKYITIDIFGKCGSQSCNVGYQSGQNKMDNCTLTVERDYKFYLSFENSLCKDYVTEKFFSRVNSSLVIVMGGANYSQVAPPHSYINVMDYASPKDLAMYLLELDRNDTAYLSYFWWKSFYKARDVGSEKMVQAQSFCRLCDKLHDSNEPKKTYRNMHDWWVDKGQCRKRKVPGMPLPQPAVHVDWKNG